MQVSKAGFKQAAPAGNQHGARRIVPSVPEVGRFVFENLVAKLCRHMRQLHQVSLSLRYRRYGYFEMVPGESDQRHGTQCFLKQCVHYFVCVCLADTNKVEHFYQVLN